MDFFHRHKGIIIYIFFGGLTTVVNYLVYYPLYNLCNMPATAANVIAWAVSVLFAYLTNKPFAFQSYDWSLKKVIPEFGKFTASRIGSGAVETLILYLIVDVFSYNGNIFKVLVSVLVVILNYLASKYLVFKK